jgi:activator of HSP90 ATPase
VLRPPEKIVQAWRATGWGPEHYSIVIFEFDRVAVGTRLTFTQIGIPPQRYSGHQRGWIETYWTPMKEVLAEGHVSEKTLARVKVDLERRIKRKHFRRAISSAG